uniref:Uncharacterized protein n=1 Tax=viral metagenome TaxID=1070528 RepID=A0A6M3LPW2_9ZZZZ
MRYYAELEVPVGTEISDPEIAEIKLTPGVIDHLSVYFPAGSAGNLYVQLWLNAYQLVPWERGQWLRGDDLLIPDSGRYEVDEEPYLLTVKGYSTAVNYSHSALVSVELTPYQVVVGAPPSFSVVGERFE